MFYHQACLARSTGCRNLKYDFSVLMWVCIHIVYNCHLIYIFFYYALYVLHHQINLSVLKLDIPLDEIAISLQFYNL